MVEMTTGTTAPVLTFLDLFCGCGGFSLGLERAGFRCLAAIDSSEEAIVTYKANFPKDTLIQSEPVSAE